jgi:RNA polymerase sigma-70 factor (ECF subfamily)
MVSSISMNTHLGAPLGCGERVDWKTLRAVAMREARGIVRDGRAEDVAQEATIRAWRHAHTCLTPEAPTAWIRAIARREALRLVGAKASEDPLPATEESDPDRPDELAHSRLDLRRAAHGLTAEERKLLVYRYWLDYSHPETAAALGLPEGTVKIRLHRARYKLREALAAERTPSR